MHAQTAFQKASPTLYRCAPRGHSSAEDKAIALKCLRGGIDCKTHMNVPNKFSLTNSSWFERYPRRDEECSQKHVFSPFSRRLHPLLSAPAMCLPQTPAPARRPEVAGGPRRWRRGPHASPCTRKPRFKRPLPPYTDALHGSTPPRRTKQLHSNASAGESTARLI